MHVELADLLRCTRAHESTPLVVAADRTRGRAIVSGTLGCPLCGAEYMLESGIVTFGDEATLAPPPSSADGEPVDALRTAAQLDVADHRRTVAFVGASVALALALQQVVPARCVVINPPGNTDDIERALADAAAPLAVLRTGETLPLAAGSLDGLLLADQRMAPDRCLAALRPGGRLVAPASAPLPSALRELVRDSQQWVAERMADETPAPAALVQLRRR